MNKRKLCSNVFATLPALVQVSEGPSVCPSARLRIDCPPLRPTSLSLRLPLSLSVSSCLSLSLSLSLSLCWIGKRWQHLYDDNLFTVLGLNRTTSDAITIERMSAYKATLLLNPRCILYFFLSFLHSFLSSFLSVCLSFSFFPSFFLFPTFLPFIPASLHPLLCFFLYFFHTFFISFFLFDNIDFMRL